MEKNHLEWAIMLVQATALSAPLSVPSHLMEEKNCRFERMDIFILSDGIKVSIFERLTGYETILVMGSTHE